MTMQRTPLLMSRLLDRGAWIAPDEEVVTLTAGGTHRQTYADTRRRAAQLANGLPRPRDRLRRPGRDVHVERLAAPRALPRGPVHRRRAPHPQCAPRGRGSRVHRQPRRGPHHLRRRGPPSGPRAARPRDLPRGTLRGLWRARRRAVGDVAPERHRLRGVHRRVRRRDRVAGVRRERPSRALLHERHHRQPERGDVHPPLDLSAHDGGGDDGHHEPQRPRLRVRGGADVPRDGLGAALRRDHARRQAGDAPSVPRARAAHRPHRVRGGDRLRRGAHHLAGGPRAPRGGAGALRPLGPRPSGLWGLRPAHLPHPLVLGRAPDRDDPRLGHDRDEPPRNHLAEGREALPPRARRGRAVRERREGGAPQPRSRDEDRGRGVPARAPGRQGARRAAGAGAVGVLGVLPTTPSRTSSGTGGW